MDVLHLMIERAASEGLLSALTLGGLRHRTLMYVDDVVTFVRPTRLDLFGHCRGLWCGFWIMHQPC
jgi:hypothetical protein